MSVINRVLNDIEQRNKAPDNHTDSSFDPVKINEPLRSSWLTGLLILTLLALTVVLTWLYFFDNRLSVHADVAKTEPQAIKAAPITPKALTAESLAPPPLLIKSPVENAKKKISKVEEALVVKADMKSSTLKQQQLSIEKVDNQVIEQVSAKALANERKVTKKKPEPSLIITPIKMSNSELSQLKFSQGLKAYKEGRIAQAQKAWEEALQAEPALHDARIQLAASYYGANDTTRALTLLLQSTSRFPAYSGYSLLAAQIYYQLDNPQQALAILDAPYKKESIAVENILLAGSIAQQLQQWPVAMNNYQALVDKQANNPQWLLGLAIAQDAQNMSALALSHYSHLLTLPGLESAVLDYVKQRAQVLREELVQRGNNG